MTEHRCLAVMYHYVREPTDGPDRDIRAVDPDCFTAQIDALCAALQPVDWPTLARKPMAGRGELPDDGFILTFDDGLKDHVNVVCPILESRGLSGVFFVSTASLADGRLSTAHALHLLLCRVPAGDLLDAVRERAAEIAGEPIKLDRTSIDEARRLYHYESPQRAELKYLVTRALPIDCADAVIAELFYHHIRDPHGWARRWYLDNRDLRRMQSAGHTIGGHGHRHVPLSRLSGNQLRENLWRCAADLRRRLGDHPRPFSYPYGNVNDAVVRACAANGFVNGFTTQKGWIDGNGDPHRLQRIDAIDIEAFVERELLCREA